MKIRFDPSFDGEAWPGPTSVRAATAGELWVGPRGLLDLLETRLGLTGPRLAAGHRAAALAPELARRDGFWSASTAVDALGCARRLITWRDELWLAGWRGQLAGGRLDTLAVIARAVEPGLPDRLAEVCEVLARRDAEVERLELVEPTADIAPLWRAVFSALEKRGTTIVSFRLSPAPARGDLAAAHRRGFRPVGDGSLQLLRPHGSGAAAEEIAAWLAARACDDTVIIQADPLLDEALHRYGLPVTGAKDPAYENHALQLLPLTIALGWDPIDPQRALELLLHPEAPLPYRLRRRLATTLTERPAVDSDEWRATVERELESLDDPERRERTRAQLATLFTAAVPRGTPWPMDDLLARISSLGAWLRRRATTDEDGTRWWHASDACARLTAELQETGEESVTAPQLERLVDGALRDSAAAPRMQAEAGVTHASDPGAVAGPAEVVVWWGFQLDRAPGFRTTTLRAAERAGLEALGVAPVPPVVMAECAAARWRRPLEQTRSELLLVCPLHGAGGDVHPHPLWDELDAATSQGASASVLIGERPFGAVEVERPRRELRTVPTPRRRWVVDRRHIQPRAAESASGLGTLLGCSFSWATRYLGRLRSRSSVHLSSGNQLHGSLSHWLIASVLERRPATDTEAERLAGQLFDREAPRRAATLFLPGHEAERAEVRQVCVRATADLVRLLRRAKREAIAIEETHEGALGRQPLSSRPDLVLGPDPIVIDLKWSSLAYHRRLLEANAAHQLAVYALMVGQTHDREPVPSGFYILKRSALLLTADADLPGGQPIPGASTTTTLAGVTRAHRDTWRQLRAGEAEACGVAADDAEVLTRTQLVAGRLDVAPSCRFCEYPALCGKAFEPEDA